MSRTTNSSLTNALRILKSFSIDNPELTLSEIAELVDVSKSTACRLIQTLESEGFMHQNLHFNTYSLGASVLALSNTAIDQLSILKGTTYFLKQLTALTGESSQIAVLENTEVIYLKNEDSQHRVQLLSHIGRRNPAHCTASGQAILAFLKPTYIEKIFENGLPQSTKYSIVNLSQLQQRLAVIRRKNTLLVKMSLLKMSCQSALLYTINKTKYSLQLAWPVPKNGCYPICKKLWTTYSSLVTTLRNTFKSMKRMLKLKHILNEKYFVASVKNAMRILRLFSPKENEFGITDIANNLNLSKSTVHRYVKELVQEGFLIQNNLNGNYRLGLSILALGGIVQSHQEIYTDAKPILVKLANRFHLPAHICVMEHNHVVYLLREMGDQPVKLITKSGRYNDLHCTAEGLAILAFKNKNIIENVLTQTLKKYTEDTITDPEILRKQILQIHYDQYAVTKDTYAAGFISFAAPIQDYTGEVVSSLALIGESKNVQENQYDEIIEVLQKSAKKISELLGYYDN